MCCFSQSTHYCAALISAVLAAAIFLVRAETSGHYFIGFFFLKRRNINIFLLWFVLQTFNLSPKQIEGKRFVYVQKFNSTDFMQDYN